MPATTFLLEAPSSSEAFLLTAMLVTGLLSLASDLKASPLAPSVAFFFSASFFMSSVSLIFSSISGTRALSSVTSFLASSDSSFSLLPILSWMMEMALLRLATASSNWPWYPRATPSW